MLAQHEQMRRRIARSSPSDAHGSWHSVVIGRRRAGRIGEFVELAERARRLAARASSPRRFGNTPTAAATPAAKQTSCRRIASRLHESRNRRPPMPTPAWRAPIRPAGCRTPHSTKAPNNRDGKTTTSASRESWPAADFKEARFTTKSPPLAACQAPHSSSTPSANSGSSITVTTSLTAAGTACGPGDGYPAGSPPQPQTIALASVAAQQAFHRNRDISLRPPV